MSQQPDGGPAQGELMLGGLGELSGDQGLSLEKLSESFARLLGQGEEPYDAEDQGGDDDADEDWTGAISPADEERADHSCDEHPARSNDQVCPVTPRSILEAMLFVGHPENEPLASHKIASLMRGVRAAEIDELVCDLNQAYAADGCPYYIQSLATGYRMALRPAYASLRAKFYRKLKQAKLSQSAIDILAIVAYHQPADRDRINKLRGQPSGSVLTQLVRRKLLKIQRRDDPHHTAEYVTTDRFLHLFGLESLKDLPRDQELESSG